ncbi:MAG: prepilin-type N-terminal cleavage/methylation domain-containing protein [Verrucomicrobia bacterium]|nr:prepilin-type N-terminal cleavage/methylation domain-containing protein [Verrucomicrobiota bacterium]
MKLELTRSTVRQSGFTLIELITVVTIIALLFSLVVGGFTYADRYSKRQKTQVTIKAVRSGLENYSQEFGGYPATARGAEANTVQIAKKSYLAVGAKCLYQAMSGDGFDSIDMSSPGAGVPQSDGELDLNEAKYVMLKDMPKELWVKNGSNFFMIDGFGHPIRYVKAAPATTGGAAATPLTVNLSSYDIWSYNEDDKNLTATSVETTTSEKLRVASQVWEKNW